MGFKMRIRDLFLAVTVFCSAPVFAQSTASIDGYSGTAFSANYSSPSGWSDNSASVTPIVAMGSGALLRLAPVAINLASTAARAAAVQVVACPACFVAVVGVAALAAYLSRSGYTYDPVAQVIRRDLLINCPSSAYQAPPNNEPPDYLVTNVRYACEPSTRSDCPFFATTYYDYNNYNHGWNYNAKLSTCITQKADPTPAEVVNDLSSKGLPPPQMLQSWPKDKPLPVDPVKLPPVPNFITRGSPVPASTSNPSVAAEEAAKDAAARAGASPAVVAAAAGAAAAAVTAGKSIQAAIQAAVVAAGGVTATPAVIAAASAAAVAAAASPPPYYQPTTIVIPKSSYDSTADPLAVDVIPVNTPVYDKDKPTSVVPPIALPTNTTTAPPVSISGDPTSTTTANPTNSTVPPSTLNPTNPTTNISNPSSLASPTSNTTNNTTNTTNNTTINNITNGLDASAVGDMIKSAIASIPGLCSLFPDILACAKPQLDTPQTPDIPTKDAPVVAVSPDGGWSSGGSCPPPYQLGKWGAFDWTPTCTFFSMFRPLLIALAWVAAGLIFIRGMNA